MRPATCKPVTLHVKICGITNLEDARVAASAGADLLGFIFYPSSPRYIKPERAGEIIAELRNGANVPKFVGVFVNEALDHVRSVMQITEIDLVQLHGNEPIETVRALTPRVYKAIRPRNHEEASANITTYRSALNGNSPAFIVDAFNEKQFGGTGERVDWNIAAGIAAKSAILLAGGLVPENVFDAIRTVRPWGVDVSSGVERAPGLKDHEKVRRFIEASKSLPRRREERHE